MNEGEQAQFAVRVFDAQGKPTAHHGLEWRLVRRDRSWDWWRGQSHSGSWTFHYYTTETEIARGTLDAGAEQPAELGRRLDWGDYRLIVSEPSSGAVSAVDFAVGWASPTADTDSPDRLDVSTDRSVAGIGQPVHVRLRGPFASPAQVIVESARRVLESRWIDLPRDGATVDLTATGEWGAGVHILAEAFRPLNAPAGAHDPVRAVGLAWVATDPAPHTLGITLGAPQMATPRQTVSVPVHVAPPGWD